MDAASRKMEADLKAFKSAYLPAFTKLGEELDRHLKIADENLQALGLLEGPCHTVQKGSLKVHIQTDLSCACFLSRTCG